MAQYEIAATTEIVAAPEQVFAVLDDFQRWPEWMPSFEHIQVELPDERPPQLGYRFRLRSGLIHTDMEVIEFTPLTRTTRFSISFPPLSGVNQCRIVPLADGKYRLERVDRLHLPDLIAHLINSTQRQRFERLAAEFLLALKRAVETRTSSQPPTLHTDV